MTPTHNHRTETKKPDADFGAMLRAAVERRRGVIDGRATEAFRVFSGAADGVDGVFVDVYGEGAAVIVYEGKPPRGFDTERACGTALEVLRPLGVRGVYLKPFARDRSRMGGELPAVTMRAEPSAGEALSEATLVRELDWTLEVRMYDGLSTGLFLDQRENRRFVAEHARRLAARGRGAPAVLNTFAYTCAFSVAAAVGGAATTSVDVSARYLEWGKRNFGHNGIALEGHRFAKMDTFEFFGYARRKELRYDLVILDPPSFAAGSKKKGIRAWSSVDDYARLAGETAGVVKPGGMVLASTNTQELCRPGRLRKEIAKGLKKEPRWIKLPEVPADFSRERERFAAVAFVV